jgi:hypothetical protein
MTDERVFVGDAASARAQVRAPPGPHGAPQVHRVRGRHSVIDTIVTVSDTTG